MSCIKKIIAIFILWAFLAGQLAPEKAYAGFVLLSPVTSSESTQNELLEALVKKADIFAEYGIEFDKNLGLKFATPKIGRSVDVEKRKRQLEAVAIIFGQAATDQEAARMLGLKRLSLRAWAREHNISLEELGFINAGSLESASEFDAEGRKTYFYDEKYLRYTIFRLMLVHLGLLNLTGRNAYLNAKQKSGNLDKQELFERELIQLGLKLAVFRLNALDIKNPKYNLARTANINYRESAREQIQKAVDLIKSNQSSAASACLATSLVNSLYKELIILERYKGERKPRSRIVYDAKEDVFKVLKAKYVYVRVQDGSISQKVYGYVPIKTRWQAMQSVDHEIDSELDDMEMMSKLISDIQAARKNLNALKNSAAPEPGELENIRNSLEAASGRLNPRWLMDKFFLKFSILIASDLVNIGKVRNADEVLGMAEGFCVRRTAECEKIISGLENGIRRTMRYQFAQKDLRIKGMIESIAAFAGRGNLEKAREYALGLSVRKDLKDEPEYFGFQAVCGWIGSITHKETLTEYDRANINRAVFILRSRMRDIEMNFEFMERFRDAYKELRLKNAGEDPRRRVFEDTYSEMLKENEYLNCSLHHRLIFYLAACQVSREVENPLNKDEKIENPAFRLLLMMSRVLAVKDIEIVKRLPGFGKKSVARTNEFVNKLLNDGKVSVHMLDGSDRKELVLCLAGDLYVKPFTQGMFLADQDLIFNGLNFFLTPNTKLDENREISDAALAEIKESLRESSDMLKGTSGKNARAVYSGIDAVKRKYYPEGYNKTVPEGIGYLLNEIAKGLNNNVLPFGKAGKNIKKLLLVIEDIQSKRSSAGNTPYKPYIEGPNKNKRSIPSST